MHNFALTINPTVSQLRTNIEILEQAANDDMYRVWVPPSMMTDGVTAITATHYAATATIPEHWELSEGAGHSSVLFHISVHPQWKNGVTWLTVLYGTNGTSAGNVVWRTDYQVLQEASALATITTGTAIPKSAPVAADTIHKLDLVSSANNNGYVYPVQSGDIAIKYRVGRSGNNAADTHTDDIRLFGVIVNYREGRREL